jgi:hypothetical protein
MNTSPFDKKPSVFSNKWIKVIAATFIGLYLIIWAISSPVSKHFIKPILLEQGLTLSDSTSIRYNPFLSQLTVSGLTLSRDQQDKQETVLSIDKLAVRLTLYRLLFDEIVISKFELTDATLKVEKTPTQLIIAGVDLSKENADDHTEKKIKTEQAPFPYQVILPKLMLEQMSIDVNNNEIPHHITIKELHISQLAANLQSQQATINLQSIIDGTELALSADASFEQGQGVIKSDLSITDYPIEKLQVYIGELSDLSGSLSFTSEQQVTIAPDQLKLHINKANLSNNDLVIGYQQQFFNLEKLENSINDVKLTLSRGEITELSGASQLILNNADIYHEKTSQKLAHFEQLAFNDISFHFDNTPQVKISSIVMDNIFGSKNEESDLPPLVSLKQIKISEILASDQQLTINKVTLDSLQSEVIIDK